MIVYENMRMSAEMTYIDIYNDKHSHILMESLDKQGDNKRI